MAKSSNHPLVDTGWEQLGEVRFWWWLLSSVVLGSGATVLWLFSISPLLVGAAGGAGAVCLFLMFLAKAKHDGEIPYVSLTDLQHVASLDEKPKTKTPELPAAPKPQPNIIMAGYPRHTFVTWDKNYVFHEDGDSPKSRRALVIDFRNELEQGKEIKSLASLKSQLTYSYAQFPESAHHVNRGFWLDREYTHTDFERGDTRTLLVGIIVPDSDGRDALMVFDNNKRESESDPIQQPGTVTFGQTMMPLRIKVAIFTQTRHRFHKECEFELYKDGRRYITKPFA